MKFSIEKVAEAELNAKHVYDVSVREGRAGDAGVISGIESLFSEIARRMKADLGYSGKIVILYDTQDAAKNFVLRLQAAPLNDIPKDWPRRYAR